MLSLTNFDRPSIQKIKFLHLSIGQDMELLMTESHMHLQDIKYSPHLLARTATEGCHPSG